MSEVCSEQFGVTTPSPLSLSSSRTVILKLYPDEYELPSKALIETSKTLNDFAILSPICSDKNLPNYKIFQNDGKNKNDILDQVRRLI